MKFDQMIGFPTRILILGVIFYESARKMEFGVQNDSLCVVEGLGDVTRHTYSRGELFAIRRKMKLIDTPIMYDLKELGILRYRGRRGGRYSKYKLFSRANLVPISTDEGMNLVRCTCSNRCAYKHHGSILRPRVLTDISYTQVARHSFNNVKTRNKHPPTLFVLNAGNLTKPHAFEQLAAEVLVMRPDVVIISESWMAPSHASDQFHILGYNLFRRDRQQAVNGKRRKGGGLLIYANDWGHRCSVRKTMLIKTWRYFGFLLITTGVCATLVEFTIRPSLYIGRSVS